MDRIISIFLVLFFSVSIVSCGKSSEIQTDTVVSDGMEIIGSMPLDYAEQFSVDYYSNGCSMVNINGDRFMIVPQDMEDFQPPENVVLIKQPVENIYLCASSAMDLFNGIDCLDKIKFTATKESDWKIDSISDKIKNNEITYAGKYSTPDYEMLISGNCSLAIESTMIYHTPEVKEQLENTGINVMVERSSYESNPLGRMEWIKLYGLICGCYDRAEQFFNEKKKIVEDIEMPDTDKTVAFFYISPNDYVNIHKPNDYVAKMIEMAGGKYIFTPDDLGTDENALSTMNLEFETFYSKAKDADIIIYNSTIDGEMNEISELIGKNSMLTDFRAVKSGEVWCTGKNMFQQTTCAGEMIRDINEVISGTEKDSLEFLHRLRQ